MFEPIPPTAADIYLFTCVLSSGIPARYHNMTGQEELNVSVFGILAKTLLNPAI